MVRAISYYVVIGMENALFETLVLFPIEWPCDVVVLTLPRETVQPRVIDIISTHGAHVCGSSSLFADGVGP